MRCAASRRTLAQRQDGDQQHDSDQREAGRLALIFWHGDYD